MLAPKHTINSNGIKRFKGINSAQSPSGGDNTGAPSKLALSLIDARRHKYGIPDLECRPSVIVTNTITANITTTSPATTAIPSNYIFFFPKSENVGLYQCVMRKVSEALNLAPLSLTVTNDALMPAIWNVIAPSRDLADSYTYIRPSGAWLGVSSSTTSTTSAAISGTITAAAINDIQDLQLFNEGELSDLASTRKDIVLQVPVYTGAIYTPGTEIIDQYMVPSTANVIPRNNAVPHTSTTVDYDNTTLATSYAMSVPTITLGQAIDIDISIHTVLWGGEVNLTFTFYSLFSTDGIFSNLQVAASVKVPIKLANDSTIIKVPTIHVESTQENPISLVPGFLVTANTTGASGTMQITVDLGFPSYTNYRRTGPLGVFYINGMAIGQTLQLTGAINYEALPSGTIGRDVKPTPSAMVRYRDPHEITLVEALFNSPDSPIKRVWNGMEYANMLLTLNDIITRRSMEHYAWSFSQLFDQGLSLLGTYAPSIGSLFGAPGALIGNGVGSLATGIHKLAYKSAGVGRIFNSAHSASDDVHDCDHGIVYHNKDIHKNIHYAMDQEYESKT